MSAATYRNPTRAIAASALAAGLFCLCSASPASAATHMGRLFFSPMERIELDRARTWPFTCLSVSGLIVRNGREHDAWMGPGFEDPRLRATVVAASDSRAAFEIQIGSTKTITLRPGQRFDMIDGGIHEVFDVDRSHCIDRQ